MHRFQKWREALQLAPDPKAIAAIVEEYVACLAPEERASLPLSCQRALDEASVDIQSAAVTLLREELAFAGDIATGALLHEIAHTFAAAATRLPQVQGLEPAQPRK